MQSSIQQLRDIIRAYAPKIEALADEEFSAKPSPHRWSKKEILGHLIDSAQNNLRRFICGQYEKTPPKITYDQDFWVRANGYQMLSKEEVLTLWQLTNMQIINVLAQMPVEHYEKTADTGEPRTLQWLAEDYVKHMKHHLNQIFAGSFDIQYS